jgi:hypothetical protein
MQNNPLQSRILPADGAGGSPEEDSGALGRAPRGGLVRQRLAKPKESL